MWQKKRKAGFDMDGAKPIVLVVDDGLENIMLVSNTLKEEYQVKAANNGQKALDIVNLLLPDIILMDVMMPEMDGYETCRRLKKDAMLKDIPVIFLAEKSEIGQESRGFELGAVDYITKPISPPLLCSRVKTHFTLKKSQDILKGESHYLEAEVARHAKEISIIQEMSIMAMAALAETRDNDTGAHIQRTKLYVKVLADHLGTTEKYKKILTPKEIGLIVASAPLHDIGKVGIPDYILLKPDVLTTEEFEIMKTHTILGRNAIVVAEQQMESSNTFLKYAREITYSHHERWNGTGYPEGIEGEDIPLSARLMAVADVYDALTTRRVYKDRIAHEMAVSIIKGDSGKHFDPDIVKAFLAVQYQFRKISQQYADNAGVLAGNNIKRVLI